MRKVPAARAEIFRRADDQVSAKYPPAAATPRPRLRGISTSRPRRRRDPSPRKIHVVATVSPRSAFTECPRRSRGVAAIRLRGISTASPQSAFTECPRRSRGVATTGPRRRYEGEGAQAIHFAIHRLDHVPEHVLHRNDDMVRLLLSYGASPNSRTYCWEPGANFAGPSRSSAKTPLMKLSGYTDVESLAALFRHGASLELTDNWGRGVLENLAETSETLQLCGHSAEGSYMTRYEACRQFVVDVRSAGGWSTYVKRHESLCLLRILCARGRRAVPRASTPPPLHGLLCRLFGFTVPSAVFLRVLGYWSYQELSDVAGKDTEAPEPGSALGAKAELFNSRFRALRVVPASRSEAPAGGPNGPRRPEADAEDLIGRAPR